METSAKLMGFRCTRRPACILRQYCRRLISLSLTPRFSGVWTDYARRRTVLTVSHTLTKPLKRFRHVAVPPNTFLKQGVNRISADECHIADRKW
jgi:hypothetical protein